MRKKFIPFILALCAAVSLLVIPAAAADTTATEDELAGTWVFNDTITYPSSNIAVEMSFESNGDTFAIFFISASMSKDIEYMYTTSDYVTAYRDGFVDTGFQTINISTKFADLKAIVGTTDGFLSWLKANATKQVECPHANMEVRNATDYYTGDTYCADCDELICSGAYLPLVTIYDGENSILYDPIPAHVGSTLTVTSTGFTLTDPSGNTESYPCAPGVDNVEYLGLAASAGSSTADYSVGSTLTITDDLSFYVVLRDTYPVNIYDGQDLMWTLAASEGSFLLVTETGSVQLMTADGTVTNYPCLPSGIAGITFLGLSTSADQTTAEYLVGSQIPLTGAADFYLVVNEVPSYYVRFLTNTDLLLETFEVMGEYTLTVNETSVVFTQEDGTSFTYDVPLGSGETFLGLAAEPTQYYGVDWAVGQTISLSSSMDFYLVTEYSYPVILNFNNGVDLKIFTGSNSCVVCVNDTSIDFISHDGTIETLSIPMNTSDDYFYGLAVSPKQITVKYPVGSVISVYSSSEFYIVRQSDIKRLTAEEVTTEGDSDASFDPDDVRSLKSVISKLLDFFKSDFSISDFFGVLNDETQYAWFSVETAGQLDTTVTSVTFGLDEESDYEKYGMDTYYDHISRVYGDKGE